MASPAEQAIQFKNLGNTAFTQGRFQEAVDHFTRAIELNPSDHVFYSNRSGAYASLENYEKALQDADACVKLKPDWAKGYQRKGLAEFYLKKYSEAETTYKVGLKIEPNNQQLKDGLERAQEELGGGGGFGQDAFTKNMMAKLISNPKTAAYLADPEFVKKLQAIQTNPQLFTMYMSDPKIQDAFQVMFGDFTTGGTGDSAFDKEEKEEEINTGTSQHQQHHHQQQQQQHHQPKHEAEPQTSSKPHSHGSSDPAENEKNVGNDFYKKRDFVKALEHYDRAIELKPNEILYYNNKAAAYIETKQYDKALESCNKALEVVDTLSHKDFTKIAKVYARMGSIYEKMENLAEAIRYFEKSLLEDQNYKVKEDLKRVHNLKKEQDAKAYINSEKAEEHNNLGKQLFQEGKFPAALKEYEEAIRRNPSDAKLYSNKAAALIKLMEYPTALKEIDRALELDPKFVRAWARKGAIHFGMKEYHRALDAYDKGLKLDPNNSECKEGLQKVQITMMSSESQKDQEERAAHAMADPEIQAILKNPSVMNVLRNMQENPSSPENIKALRDPVIGPQIQKLIAAGILKTG